MLFMVIVVFIIILLFISGDAEVKRKKLKQGYEEQILQLKDSNFRLQENINSLHVKLNSRLNPDEIMIEKLQKEIRSLNRDKENMEQYVQSYKNTYLDIQEKKTYT